MSYQSSMTWMGQRIVTLKDIIPNKPTYKILFVGKRPEPGSVQIGHYFRGNQGKNFWNKLKKYGLLDFKKEKYPDDYLISNNYGITDIVKTPAKTGIDPTRLEIEYGLVQLQEKIRKNKPQLIVFVYKKALDWLVKYSFNQPVDSFYGFNPQYEGLLGIKLFVFPTSGTPCDMFTGSKVMEELVVTVRELK